MKKLFFAALMALFPICANAQTIGAGSYAQTRIEFINTGTNTWIVPPGVTSILVDACGAGGGGAGGV